MTFNAGTKLGAYEIVSAIGSGGFGAVYKARDTRLNRTVAIKVLSEDVSNTTESRQRFEREAQTIAGLKHSNICVLYDVGNQDGTDFLVMEYIEGETLAQRLTRGPLPVDQALKVAIEIADALDKAHRQGITHRDLKPGNIMLTKSGSKLLDFGLAKLAKLKSSPIQEIQPSDMSTAGLSDLTAKGTILGTVQYMSPEQLDGIEADARSDIFAFGAVVYEMVAGRKAFEGPSQSSVIAAIMKVDPPAISVSQPITPPALERVVKMCLAKDPEERWQTARDLHSELRWIADGGSHAGIPVPVAVHRRMGERVAWIAVVAVFAVIAIAAAVIAFRPSAELPEIRVEVNTPPTSDPLSFAISPDGKRLLFSASKEGKSQLWVRTLDSLAAQALAGTEGAVSPFWSPDSASLGFRGSSDARFVGYALLGRREWRRPNGCPQSAHAAACPAL